MKTWTKMTRRAFMGSVGAGGAALVLGAAGGSAAGHSAGASAEGSHKLPSWLEQEAKSLKGRSTSIIGSAQYFKTTDNDFISACKTFGQLTGTNIDVSVINAETGNIVSREDAATKAGNPPDMIYVNESVYVPQLRGLGDLQPVTDVVDELTTHYGKPPDVTRIYLYDKNQWWGVPFFGAGGGFFARKDWLAEKGIKPSEVKTFTNLRDVALEISDPAKQRYGWGMTYTAASTADGFGLITDVLNAYGAAIASNDGTKVIFGNGSETREAVSFLADIYTNSKYSRMLPPGVAGWDGFSNNDAWLAGVIGFTSNGFSLYAQAKATHNPVYEETLVIPGFLGPAIKRVINVPGAFSFVLFKGAKDPKLAKALAKYLVAGQPLLQMAKDSAGLVLPAYENVWTSNRYFSKGDPAFKPLRESLAQPLPIRTSTGLAFPQAASPGYDAVDAQAILQDMMAQIVTKKAGITDAISTARQRMIGVFEQQGFPQS